MSDQVPGDGWGNEPGTPDDDQDAWYRANPSLGVWISPEFVEKERRSLGRCDPIPTRGAQGVWEWPLSRGSQPGEAS